MCAVFGCLLRDASPQPALLERMSAILHHRGPDDRGEFLDAEHGVALGHRRLSIIDLSAASHQPMVDAGTGVVLAYNGELYNFQELRGELEGLGHAFRSSGDTEVVLRAYLQWGVSCLERFAGMFAIAIWDPRSRVLHVARDAMGIKPLYYTALAQGFFFASELKALCAVPAFEPSIDPLAVRQYLEFGYVFDQSRTILRGACKLPPGYRAEIREGRVTALAAWFRPPAPEPHEAGEHERVEELARTLEAVTRQHLIADVPVGMLLSGGIDSGILAALAARSAPLRTVTMAFSQSQIDERPAARAVSSFIGSQHTEIVIEPQHVRAEIERGAWVFDDLFADWGTVTTRLLYRHCREQGLKVILVGEGADELFGGYDIFDVAPRLGLWGRFRLYQRYSGRRWGSLFPRFQRAIDGYLAECGGDAFDAVRLFESRRQLPNQYVMKVDKASMAESVEARAPYLDRRVAELAYRTPRAWLQRGGENKFLLRALARQQSLLPAGAAERRKFGAPLAANWMDEDEGMRSFARDRLLDPGGQTARMGLTGAMQEYFVRGRDGYPFPAAISIFRNLAWRLLLLEMWSRHYLRPSTP